MKLFERSWLRVLTCVLVSTTIVSTIYGADYKPDTCIDSDAVLMKSSLSQTSPVLLKPSVMPPDNHVGISLQSSSSNLPKSGRGYYLRGYTANDYYMVKPGSVAVKAYCIMSRGGWTVIDPSVDSNWSYYFNGWGSYAGGLVRGVGNSAMTWREWFQLSTPTMQFATSSQGNSVDQLNAVYRMTGNYYGVTWFNMNCHGGKCIDDYGQYSSGYDEWMTQMNIDPAFTPDYNYPYSASDWWNTAPSIGANGTHCIAYLDPDEKPTFQENKDQGKNPNDNTVGQGDDVNVTNGNMYLSFKDFSMRGRGLSTEIVRTYNSQSQYDGPFGYGWTFDYSEYLKIETDSVILRNKHGSLATFTLNSDGSYNSPPGEYSKLVKNGGIGPSSPSIAVLINSTLKTTEGVYSLTTKNGIVYNFNYDGKLVAITDRNGNSNMLSYSNGKLDKVTDLSGRSLRLFYNSNNKISAITDPAGRIVSYEYDENGNLIKVTDPASGTTQYAYDANHNMVTVTNANGTSTHFTYDDQDRCTDTRQDNNIQAYSFVYHPESLVTEMTDGNNHKTTFHYDAEKGVNLSITDTNGGVTSFIWDENLNRTSITAPNGAVTKFTYDQSGNPLTVTNPIGGISTFTYEPKYNLVTSITNPMDQRTIFNYDAKGNTVTITNALGNISSFIYDEKGDLLSMKAPNGAQTSYSYDAGGHITEMIDALGNKTLLQYDSLGNLLNTTNAKGSSTAFTYNILNRLIQINFPDGTKSSFTYDAAGNCLSSTDQNGNITSFAYDSGNRMIRKTEPTGSVTEYTYDLLDNLLSLKDSNGGAYQYYYDTLDRVVESVSPIGSRTKFSYDPIGNVVSVKDANGNTIDYDYDLNNKLLKKTYPDGANVSYIYDANGNRISMTDSLGTSRYSYDILNRLTAVDGPDADDMISYSYDAVGNRVSMTDQDGNVTSYKYDGLNRLADITDPYGRTSFYGYDTLGNIISKSYPNGIVSEYTYDGMNNLTRLGTFKEFMLPHYFFHRGTSRTFRVSVESYAYSYDPAGMKTMQFADNKPPVKYSYDANNQLVETVSRGDRQKYSYDLLGNIISSSGVSHHPYSYQSYGYRRNGTR